MNAPLGARVPLLRLLALVATPAAGSNIVWGVDYNFTSYHVIKQTMFV